jgi:hypothetical protein
MKWRRRKVKKATGTGGSQRGSGRKDTAVDEMTEKIVEENKSELEAAVEK